jgi:ubiquinone/menaquinone biosynthesis C-methylase UbiE
MVGPTGTEDRLPYFDQILERIADDPSAELRSAFARHVHWGYYADPEQLDTSVEGYVRAAEALTDKVVALAALSDGHTVLDIGCGFGGTLAHIAERRRGCRLLGLNIDLRQLRHARHGQHLSAASDANRVALVQGDAAALPFADQSADAILAIECAFHFPSRRRFFREAARVARPDARLAMTDFVLREGALADLARWVDGADRPAIDFYGTNQTPLTSAAYERLGQGAGFELVHDEDITRHTVPTYQAMADLYARAGLPDGVDASRYLAQIAATGFVEYHVLAFERRSK